MTKLPVTTIKELKCRKYSLGSWSGTIKYFV